jgi:hypothetical protein
MLGRLLRSPRIALSASPVRRHLCTVALAQLSAWHDALAAPPLVHRQRRRAGAAPRPLPHRIGLRYLAVSRESQQSESAAGRELPVLLGWRGYTDRLGERLETPTYSASWLRSLATIPQSKVVRAIRWVLLAQAWLSTSVVGLLHAGLVKPWPFWEMPHALLSVALGLLLVHG